MFLPPDPSLVFRWNPHEAGWVLPQFNPIGQSGIAPESLDHDSSVLLLHHRPTREDSPE